MIPHENAPSRSGRGGKESGEKGKEPAGSKENGSAHRVRGRTVGAVVFGAGGGFGGNASGPAVVAGPEGWWVSGGVLLSHRVSPAVPSALSVLASGFGMGPGVSHSLWPPERVVTRVRCVLLCWFRLSVGNHAVDASVCVVKLLAY